MPLNCKSLFILFQFAVLNLSNSGSNKNEYAIMADMAERPLAHSSESATKTGERYLLNLGLTWAELQGKKVLDIGASSAEFETAARQQGVNVVSVDKEMADGYLPPIDSNFVVANATQLPFEAETFDTALAHMSVMNYMESGYEDDQYLSYIEDVLKETNRVLSPGGRFHFTDTTLEEEDLQRDQDDAIPPRPSDAYEQWRMEREHQVLEEIAKRAGFSELQLHKHIESGRPRPEDDEHVLHYYVAVK